MTSDASQGDFSMNAVVDLIVAMLIVWQLMTILIVRSLRRRVAALESSPAYWWTSSQRTSAKR
jgi:hypothetical protein